MVLYFVEVGNKPDHVRPYVLLVVEGLELAKNSHVLPIKLLRRAISIAALCVNPLFNIKDASTVIENVCNVGLLLCYTTYAADKGDLEAC